MLKIANISKTFSPTTHKGEGVMAVSDVSLDVKEGEFVSLVGPSGCGKSTLINIVAGLIDGYEGQVAIDGQLVKGLNKDVGMVFQEDSTFPWLTAQENVEFGLRMRGENVKTRSAASREMLDLVGLGEFADSYPSELSGGMRQRVAIARALVLQPRLLLMDEPFGAVDEQTRILLGEELLRLRDQLNQTVIFVTHNLGEAVTLSDRVVAMTARPARIKDILTVELPTPHDSTVMESKEYARLVGQLWHLLREEALQTLQASEGRLGGGENAV